MGSNSRIPEERNKLLRQWVTTGGNIDAIEARLEIQRIDSLKGQRVWEQVAVKDMGLPPLNFSKHLGGYKCVGVMLYFPFMLPGKY